MIREHPWLLDYLDRTALQKEKKHLRDDSEDDLDIEPMDIFEVWGALDSKRKELDAAAHKEDDFIWKVRGGAWTKEHKGCEYDAFMAVASTPLGEEFCKLFQLRLSASFSLALYGEALAMTLCSYWCSKHQHWLDIWVDKGEPEEPFIADELRTFMEPIGFTEMANAAVGQIRDRTESLRALAPGEPKVE
jgi:hypothetical protein